MQDHISIGSVHVMLVSQSVGGAGANPAECVHVGDEGGL